MSKSPLVIGVGHKARNGKDTFSNYMVETLSDRYDVRRYAFATRLKEEVNQLDQFAVCMKQGIPYDPQPDMSDPLCQTRHGKQSRLLQFWGAYRRSQMPAYWILPLAAQIATEKPDIAVISDVRYANEFDFVKMALGIMVKVRRLGFKDLSRNAGHSSETELDSAPFDIDIAVEEGKQEELRQDAIDTFNLIYPAYKNMLHPELATDDEPAVVEQPSLVSLA